MPACTYLLVMQSVSVCAGDVWCTQVADNGSCQHTASLPTAEDQPLPASGDTGAGEGTQLCCLFLMLLLLPASRHGGREFMWLMQTAAVGAAVQRSNQGNSPTSVWTFHGWLDHSFGGVLVTHGNHSMFAFVHEQCTLCATLCMCCLL